MRLFPKFSRRMKRSIRFELTVSYVILLFLPLASWLMMQLMSNQVIHNLATATYTDVLKAAVTRIDTEISSVLETAQKITADKNVLLAINNQDPVSGRNAYRNRQVVNYLYECRLNLKTLESINLYLHDTDRVIASECATRANIYYDMRYAAAVDLSFDEWNARMKQVYRYEFRETAGLNGGKRLWLLLTLPFSNAPEHHIQATLVLEMQEDIFNRLYGQLDLENGLGFEMIEPGGNRVFSSGSARPAEWETTLSQTSADTGWRYILHVPDDLIERSTGYVLRRTSLALVVLTLGSFLMIFYFVRRHYSPIRTVMRMVEANTGIHAPAEVSGREYVFLQTLINNVVTDNRNNRAQLEQYAGSLRSAYLSNLLLGSVGTDESFDMLGFDLASGAFSVLIVHDAHHQKPDIAGLSRIFLIGNAEEDLFLGEGTAINRQAVFLLDCTDLSAADYKAAVTKLLSLAPPGRYVLAGSDMYMGAQGVAEAYREASYHMDYALSSGKPYSMAGMAQGDSELDLKEIQLAELREALAGSDYARACTVISRVYDLNRPVCRDNLPRARLLTATLLSVVLQAGESARIPTSQTPEISAIWDQYAQTHDYESMELLLTDITIKLCALMREKRRGGNGELKDEILSYLDTHYTDPNLSVEGVCREFGRSSATISRLFKDDIEGGTLNNQIAIRRIARAKQLIVETKGEIQISELCGMVGYASMNTFLRQFKRLEGITPGKFREITYDMSKSEGREKN